MNTNNAPAADSSEMPFTEHLAELRNRLVKSLLAVTIASMFCFGFAEPLFSLLTQPLHDSNSAYQAAAGADAHPLKLIGTGPAEAFLVKLKVAIGAGVILASPLLFFQLWCFIAPGLHSHERQFAIPFVAGSTVFFLLGVLFCFLGVLPFAFAFFVKEYSSIGVSPDIRIGEYLSFTVRILLIFGVVFELPILSFFLARFGLVSADWLKRQGRYGIVGIFVVAAVLTPPDPITQCLLAGPLIVLYGLCILVAKFAAPAETDASEEAPQPTRQ